MSTEWTRTDILKARQTGYLEWMDNIAASLIWVIQRTGVHHYGQDGNEPIQNPQGPVIVETIDLQQLISATYELLDRIVQAIEKNDLGEILEDYEALSDLARRDRTTGQLPDQMDAYLRYNRWLDRRERTLSPFS